MDTILQDHGTKAFEEAREAFLLMFDNDKLSDMGGHLKNCGEAIGHSLISGEDGHHLPARVQVVNDAPRALEQCDC